MRTRSCRWGGTETSLTGEAGEAGAEPEWGVAGAWLARGRGVAGGGPVQSTRSLAAQKQWAGRGAGSCPVGRGSSEGRGAGRAHLRRGPAGDSAAGGAPESEEAAGDAGRSPRSPPGRGKASAGGRRGGALGSGSSLHLRVLPGGGHLNREFVRGNLAKAAGCPQGQFLLPGWTGPVRSLAAFRGHFGGSRISKWCPRVDEGVRPRGRFCGSSPSCLPLGQSKCGPGVGVSWLLAHLHPRRGVPAPLPAQSTCQHGRWSESRRLYSYSRGVSLHRPQEIQCFAPPSPQPWGPKS